MKKIVLALAVVTVASCIAFAETAPAATAAAAPAATAAAAPAATAPVALSGSIVKVIPANKAKATPEQIVVKGADGKEITLDVAKTSTLKSAAGKAIAAKSLKAGEKVAITYTAGDKANLLVTLEIVK